MERILLCHKNGKEGYKNGENGFCYTYNKNTASRRKAYDLATNTQQRQNSDAEA